MEETKPKMSAKRKAVKAVKILAAAAAVLAGILVVAAVLFVLRPAREGILGAALPLVQRALPGDLNVGAASWPDPGTMRFEDVVWTNGPDTLAVLDTLHVSVRLRALVRRDVHVEELALSGVRADIVAIAGLFPAGGGEPDKNDEGGDAAFPRDGALPGVPSIAVDRVAIDARRIRVSEALDLHGVVLAGNAEVRSGSQPRISVTELSLRESVSGASVDSLWFTADLSTLDINGEGVVRIPGIEPWFFGCTSNRDGEFRVRLASGRDAEPPLINGLLIDGRAEIADARVESVDFDVSFRLPDSGELLRVTALESLLSGPLADTTPLRGLRGSARGSARLEPDTSLRAELDLFPNSWFDTLHVSAAYTNKGLVVDTLELAAPGLSVAASAGIPPAGGSARARVDIEDARWLSNILPGTTPPESLTAALSIEVSGLTGPEPVAASLSGVLSANGIAIDTLVINAVIPRDEDKPLDIELLVRSMGSALATRARVRTAPDIVVTLLESETRGDRGVNSLTGDFVYNPDDRSIRLSGVRLEGDLGDYLIDAAVDSLLRGTFDIECRWPQPPSILLEGLEADSTTLAAVDSAWSADGPFTIHVEGELTRDEDAHGVSAVAELRLPGPRDLAPLVGDAIDVDDWGPVEGRLEFVTGACETATSFTARLDLGRTSWLDTALVDVTGCGAEITFDTLLVSFDHLRLRAAGGRRDGQYDLHAFLSMADSLLLTRFVTGPVYPGVTLDAAVHLTGPADSPRLVSDLEARFETADLRVPRVAGHVEFLNDSLTARVELPDGAHGYGMVMDSLSLEHEGIVRGEILSGNTVLSMRGPDTFVLISAYWEQNGGITVRCDTVFVSMMEQEIVSARPFQLTLSTDNEFRVDELVLEGSLGSVVAAGYTSPDSAEFNADIVIHTPRRPGFVEIADRLWPDSLIIHADVDGPATFHITTVVEGIELAGKTSVRALLEFHSNPDSTRALVAVTSPDRRLLEATGRLPSYRLGEQLGTGPVELDAVVDRFPLPAGYDSMFDEEPGILGWLDGRVTVRGTADDPSGIATFECAFAEGGGAELAKYRVNVDAVLTGSAGLDTELTRIGEEWLAPGMPDTRGHRGVVANLAVTKSGAPVADGKLVYPVAVSLSPLSAVVPDDTDMNLEFRTTRIALTDFDPLLPPDLDLEGTCALEFSARGNPGNPSLQGTIDTDEMKIVSARGAQISQQVNLELGGNVARPSIKGNVQIRSGFIRIPEQKASLHPSEGTSILWQAADSARTAADSSNAGPFDPDAGPLELPEVDPGLDLDIKLEIPGSFRIIGSRMNVVLSGELSLVQRGSTPVLTGQLIPQSGQLLFMGRNFELQRGNVNFYGGDELNPALDLTLVTEVAGYRVEIRLTGTMKDPEIELTSEPQLPESDIMSLLVFGQPMNELSSSQSGHLQQRTAEVLMVYGAVKLQEQMSKQTGVDIITIQQSTRKPDESALVVGKSLNSRTLLKYEQSLENTGTYLIRLEYILTKRIRFETFVDQASETGIEINWMKDY